MTSTSLFSAVQDGSLQIARELLLQGNQGLGDVNTIRDNYGGTPLHVACHYARLQVAKFLIQEYNADVNAVEIGGWTPLMHTCNCHSGQEEDATAVATLLLENGAKVNSKTNQDQTALHVACARPRGRTSLVQLLLNHGADTNALCIRGQTPLHKACYKSRIDVIKLLLANNADRHVKDKMGQGPAYILQQYSRCTVFTSYDTLPLAVSGFNDKTRTSICKKRKRISEMVRVNQHLSRHQHALALKALLLVRQLPVHEVLAYEILGFLTPAAVEKIFSLVE